MFPSCFVVLGLQINYMFFSEGNVSQKIDSGVVYFIISQAFYPYNNTIKADDISVPIN